MIDFAQLQELYDARESSNERVSAAAQAAIDSKIEGWIHEFLNPVEKEDRSFWFGWCKTYDELADGVTGWLDNLHGESKEEFRARCEKVRGDKLRVLLTAHLWPQASRARKDDYEIATILGEEYLTMIWGCGPDHEARVAEYRENCKLRLAARHKVSALSQA